MSDLIERLRAATGPSRELDAEIAAAVHGGTADPSQPGWVIDGTEYMAICYTESLDAAMSLRLPGFTWAAGDINHNNIPWACVTSDETHVDYASDAVSPEIATVIAWLLSRGTE